MFWRKVLDIYATSIDYDPKSEISIQFFKQVQNKMHWAAHHHTAAEVIYERADSDKEFMGLTNWHGAFPQKSDVEIAKNYLNEEEIAILERLVSTYLVFIQYMHNSIAMSIDSLSCFLISSIRSITTDSIGNGGT